MKKQAFNPYLPSWEYIPDGEPHVFDGRVYVYGSHDLAHGWVFCLGDYVCWSAPVDDLADWRYEGVIYPRTADPLNKDGKMVLYAPDVTQGPDGRYYLYYVLDKVSVVSVAVCDTPAGKYEFYGYVHYADGTRLGERNGDEPQFDPGVLTEGETTCLYTGFCARGDKTRTGSRCVTLAPDMLTITQEPVTVVPGCECSAGTGFEGHEFFEASSIRKIGNMYYFVYSSIVMHELCYATSYDPRGKFTYGGVLVSNCDLHIGTYKNADMPTAYGANNHGSIERIGGSWYVFYHRHTNATWYSRQGCAERITVLADGSIPQVELTSSGLNGGPLAAAGEYPAHIACNLFKAEKPEIYVGEGQARVTTDGRDGDEVPSYIADITDGTVIGFKYFDYASAAPAAGTVPASLAVKTRGYGNGVFQVKTTWDGDVLGEVPVEFTNFWEEFSAPVSFPKATAPLYLVFKGSGTTSLLSFSFK